MSIPKERTVARIYRAARLQASGVPIGEIARRLGISTECIQAYRREHPTLWQQAYDAAMGAVVDAVRAAAGSDAVLDDPDLHLRQAERCQTWLSLKGEVLFPTDGKTTLADFFEGHYRPTRLADASPRTVERYRCELRQWALLTGDPDIREVTSPMLGKYRDALSKMRGAKPHLHMSAESVRTKLKRVQTLLDAAGPPDRYHRDAAGILPGPVPWVKPPRVEFEVKPVVPLERLADCYTAAVAMDVPRINGFRASLWWRTLLAVAYNTGLRRGSLFALRWEWLDLEGGRGVVPSGSMKSRRPLVVYLNPTAVAHLRRIRTNRELVFPWPRGSRNFDTCFHRLQTAAGIAPADWFGLQAIRRLAATMLWQSNPSAAQFALGHTGMDVTRHSYVDGGALVARAVEALPQPGAFTAG